MLFRMKSRLLILLAMTVLFSIALAPVTWAKTTTITMYFQWEPVIETMNAAARLYEQKNPGVKIEIIPACIDCVSGYEKLVTSIAAGTAPDLVTLNGSFLAEQAVNGLIDPIDSYLAGTDWKGKYQPAIWSGRTVNGRIYGLPAFEGGPGRGLIYNIEHLDEVGLPVPSDSSVMTWDEFGLMARRLAKYDADKRLTRVGYYPKETGGNSLGSMSTAFMANWYNSNTGLAELDQPWVAEAMETMKRLFYDPWGWEAVEAAVKGKGLWTNHKNSLFATGGSSSLTVGYWAPGELRVTMPNGNIGVTWVPQNQRKRVQTIGAWSLCLLSSGKQKEEAWKAMQFFASPETTKLFFTQQGWLGGLHKDIPRYVDLRTNPGAAWYIQSLDKADYVPVDPINLWSADADRYYSEVYDKVVAGKGDAKPLLAEANRVLNARILESRQRK